MPNTVSVELLVEVIVLCILPSFSKFATLKGLRLKKSS